MNVIFDRGLHLVDLGLWLDGRVKRAEGFISHAHSDHVARHSRALMTRGTETLLRPLLKKTDCHVLEYGETLETPSYWLTLYPAGHCLGSAQVLVTSRATGERTLYTGDLKLKPNPTAAPARPVGCDTLIIEATYGHPQYLFPPQEEVLERCYAALRSWLSGGRTPVVVGYRVGKSQEILHHLLAAGFDVALERSVWEVTQRYQQAGVEFPHSFRFLDGRPREGEVVVRPPGGRRSVDATIPGSRTVMLTGWSAGTGPARWARADEVVPFSDHADFNDLVDYVKAVQPRRVFTVYGFPHLADHLRKLGYQADHLDGMAAGQQLRLL